MCRKTKIAVLKIKKNENIQVISLAGLPYPLWMRGKDEGIF